VGRPPSKTALGTALAGLVLGAVAVPLFTTSFPLALVVFAVVVGLVTLRRDSRALGGGFLVAFGIWWVYFVRQAVDRCDAFNTGGGSCTIFGTEQQLALAASIVALGVLLVVVAVRDREARA